MLKLVFLTEAFRRKHSAHTEIEQKEDRPYARVQINVNGVVWALPLRSNINHPYAIWTDKANKCGIDLSKAVVIEDPTVELDHIRTPYLRDSEFRVFKTFSEYEVVKKFHQYIRAYKKAKENSKVPRNKMLLNCSTLQYFEQYI